MNRTIGGLPLYMWGAALGAGILGFLWFRKNQKTAPPNAAGAKQPSFSQQQEVQDFQIFSALTGAQQASDLNFLGTVAGLFAGGASTGVGSGGSVTGSGGSGGTVAPAPPSTGTAPPATIPASVSSQYQSGLANAISGQPAGPGVAAAISGSSNPGATENFLLLNQANKNAGYDYYSSTGLVTTPLGVAPGE